MSYEIGTHINLQGVVKQAQAVPVTNKKSIFESAQQSYQVGTQFVFSLTPAGFKTAIKIPVAFA